MRWTHSLATQANIYGFVFLNYQKYGQIYSSERRDARSDGQDIRTPRQSQGNGWALGQIQQILGGQRHTGKQEDTKDFDYEEALWTLW